MLKAELGQERKQRQILEATDPNVFSEKINKTIRQAEIVAL